MVSVCFLLLTLGPLQVAAPQYRSYPPDVITVTTGTGTGTIADLYTVDGMVYDVVEEDLGTSSLHTATESWIVQGTLDSGTFPDDMQTQDDTGVVYLEADDGSGVQDRWYFYVPMGVGTYSQWTPSAAVPNWQQVDDDPPHDGDTTYVFTTGNLIVDTYAMENLGVMPVGYDLDGNLFAFAWGKTTNAIGSGQGLSNRVITNAREFDGPVELFLVQHVYQNVSNEWVTNPDTGLDWTVAEINAMEVGMVSTNPVPLTTRVTSVGLVVPLRLQNFVLDIRHNITSVPGGREFYDLEMTARVDSIPAETMTVSVYDHVAPGWDVMFTFDSDTYASETFALTLADHVNDVDEVWIRSTDAAGDSLGPDAFNIDLLRVHAYDVEYALEVSFQWIGLGDFRSPQLNLEGYRSDAETISLHVWRSGTWYTLSTNVLWQGSSRSRAYDLAPADVVAGTLEVRFVDNVPTDNTQSTIFLNWLSLAVEIHEGSPRAPIDVYASVSYDLWGNDVLLSVRWIQVGGPEPAQELGRYATLWADGVLVGTYEIHGDGSTRVSAPWSYFDGEEHTLNVTGAVAVAWPTFGGNQTYYSDMASLGVENLPRWAVLVVLLCIVLTIVAAICVRAVKSRYEEEPHD